MRLYFVRASRTDSGRAVRARLKRWDGSDPRIKTLGYLKYLRYFTVLANFEHSA